MTNPFSFVRQHVKDPREQREQTWHYSAMGFWKINQRRVSVKPAFALWPRRCLLTEQWLWFRQCYVVTTMVTGPGGPEIDKYWIEAGEFLLHELKHSKNINTVT